MRLPLLLLLLVLVTSAVTANMQTPPIDVQASWDNFKQKYNKSYETDEEENYRMKIFFKNLRSIIEHNEKNTSFTMALNHLADRPTSERRCMNVESFMERNKSNITRLHNPNTDKAYPESWDWRNYGIITSVKRQGECDSCWAFSAVGALEGQHAKRHHVLVDLSAQHLVDCDLKNEGCDGGGYVELAYDYIVENGWIATSASYPYREKALRCRASKATPGATCTGYSQLDAGEKNLKEYIVDVGPISASIDGSGEKFQNYEKGIHYDEGCAKRLKDMNHALLVVGYGSEVIDDELWEYWICKNSYGTNWGEGGYIHMARNRRNQCGIATFGVVPIVP